jgi:hypothetical protein
MANKIVVANIRFMDHLFVFIESLHPMCGFKERLFLIDRFILLCRETRWNVMPKPAFQQANEVLHALVLVTHRYAQQEHEYR